MSFAVKYFLLQIYHTHILFEFHVRDDSYTVLEKTLAESAKLAF